MLDSIKYAAYRCNYQWKGLYRLLLWYVFIHCTTQPASLLLHVFHVSGCMAAVGEVAFEVSFHYLWNIHLLLWNSYNLCLTIPLFAAMFRIHADDDYNFSPINSFPLYTASSLVIIICNLQVLCYHKSVFIASVEHKCQTSK